MSDVECGFATIQRGGERRAPADRVEGDIGVNNASRVPSANVCIRADKIGPLNSRIWLVGVKSRYEATTESETVGVL